MSKHIMKQLALTLGAGLAIVSGAALAASTYGYSATGTGAVSATANVKVTVTVPKLIILRVGTSGATVDTLAFTAGLDATGIPGGVTTLTAGNSQASGWTGVAPVWGTPTSTPSPASVAAYVWTNATGATLAMSTAVTTPLTGITPANIGVSATGTNFLSGHPANTSLTTFAGTIPSNTAITSTWTYSILNAATVLAATAAGTYAQTTTYTATAL